MTENPFCLERILFYSCNFYSFPSGSYSDAAGPYPYGNGNKVAFPWYITGNGEVKDMGYCFNMAPVLCK